MERSTVIWQRSEGALVFASTMAFIALGDIAVPSWWVCVLIFFAPDLSFAGYLLGNRVGAFVYNFVHSYGLGAALIALALATGSALLGIIGVLWTGHAGFDRMFGYGLKLPTGFHDTHLGGLKK